MPTDPPVTPGYLQFESPKLDMEPGSLRGLHLVVADIEAERNRLIANGIDVEPVEDVRGVQFAYFADPDGNTWTLQHLPWRPTR
ncbi:VOC family protein [Kribbella italica]|uniref:Catechol 2,3-dioxygenase-like lactoylglutathione lyase family enzyme n=1 Tax=Kribbella italica TaxID=1540520 RepID=A0A7W9JDU2_9ACTN|nr:VOC family protein [Kribbella italica]MBB5840155.1 catechol 2,3-dioxygenase-like lactoylglutathione lyase family enzyme [Kribbella italica]